MDYYPGYYDNFYDPYNNNKNFDDDSSDDSKDCCEPCASPIPIRRRKRRVPALPFIRSGAIFLVSVVNKIGHPWEHHITESNEAFAINGVKGAVLFLKRGGSYTFTINQPNPNLGETHEHLLFFTADPTGGRRGGKFFGDLDPTNYEPRSLPNLNATVIHNTTTNNNNITILNTQSFIIADGSITFTITNTFPRIFYYQCKNHQFEGGLIIVVD